MSTQWSRGARVVVALALVAGAAACGKGDNSTGPGAQTFVANLSPANEVPPKTTASSGTATFSVTGNQITLTSLTVQNIDSVTASHIHLNVAGQNGGIAVPLLALSPPSGHIVSQTLVSNLAITQSMIVGLGSAAPITTDSLLALFRSGGAYVNVHTRANPAGEIRGQIHLQ